jgi:FixJ family two-component response regulator
MQIKRYKAVSRPKPVIAIVDDDPSFSRGLSRMLRANDFKVEVFDSCEDFIERGATYNVACIILDIHMGGMSGIELRRRLAAEGSTIPVIFMTAHDSAAVRNEAIEAGCAAFLPKPFSGQKLIDVIRTAIPRS